MKRISILWVMLWILGWSAGVLEGAYYLNGKKSTAGFYAYDVPPPANPPIAGGDIGVVYHPFGTGVLMDGEKNDPGVSIAWPQNPDDPYVRVVLMDLGQEVEIQSVRVSSRLAAWWGIGYFQVSFSRNGESFSPTMDHPEMGNQYPHKEGLYVAVELEAKVTARFLRFRFSVPSWNHVQIGEIDITAVTAGGEAPVAEFSIKSLQEVYRRQVESPAVDAFGQWARDEWQGKIRNEKELVEKIHDDEDYLLDVELDPDRFDRYGGDITLGIQTRPGEKFRLEKVNGRWWFITPEGNPFVMIAVDGVGFEDGLNMNTMEYPGKPEIGKDFAELPPREGRFADCWWSPPVGWMGVEQEGVWRFNFFRANVIRGFGSENYGRRFENLVQRRLIDWGFNSRGKWTGKDGSDRPLPFIQVAGLEIEKGIDFTSYNGLADPWDPYYPTAVENRVKQLARDYGSDPYFIGFTIGNEEWWDGEVTTAVLESRPAKPAKKEFVRQLQSQYKDIQALNQKCQAGWVSFDEVLETDLTDYKDSLKDEITRFIELSSGQFYRVWREAVDTHDPGRLILGSSFVLWWKCCPEWVRGSIPYCDAMMLDDYPLEADGILTNYVQAFAVPADKPVLLGEYSFTTAQRGFKPYRCQVASQKERGLHYQKFNEKLFAHPNWVGSMWFLYRDQVLLGRNPDNTGESHNFGLVDICNIPYYEMVNIMKATNKKLYSIHAGE